jgi:GNAT superfamily N-acetyltransferase
VAARRPKAPGPPPGHGHQLAVATAPWTSRFQAFDEALEDHHPAGLSHQHLAILAVRPGCQGQDIGTALLTARLHDLDRDGVPAYLEASSPAPAT